MGALRQHPHCHFSTPISNTSSCSCQVVALFVIVARHELAPTFIACIHCSFSPAHRHVPSHCCKGHLPSLLNQMQLNACADGFMPCPHTIGLMGLSRCETQTFVPSYLACKQGLIVCCVLHPFLPIDFVHHMNSGLANPHANLCISSRYQSPEDVAQQWPPSRTGVQLDTSSMRHGRRMSCFVLMELLGAPASVSAAGQGYSMR